MNKTVVSTSPHITHIDTSRGIMLDVILALFPTVLFSLVLFGPRTIILTVVCAAVCVFSEFICNKIMKRPISIGDLSAVVTGILLAMNLPPQIPFWIAALGCVIAIVVAKQLFGGIGQNFANPAITARIALTISFPVLMTTWSDPGAWWLPSVDVVSSATPLANPSSYSLTDLLFGITPGCLGETCALLLLAGGIYLVVRKVISPTIPLCFIGVVYILSFISCLCDGANFCTALVGALAAILSGGLFLGAIFMATDYSTSPTTFRGKIIFGVGCGLLTFIIRRFGSLNEGVSFAILIMNILVVHINKLTASKPFGWEGKKC